jgi:glycosyltransferase involved in cell wall biosynthesis
MLIAVIGNSAESLLNFRSSLIRRLIERGHEIVAFAPDFNQETLHATERLGAVPISFPLSRGGTNPFADLKSLLAVRRALCGLQPDAVLSYFIKPAIYGNLAAAMAGVPRRVVMLEGLGYGFADDKQSIRRRLINKTAKLLLRFSLSRSHTVIVLNEDDRHAIIELSKTSPNNVVNMGGIGVDLDQFTFSTVRENATVFAMAARLIAEKGVVQYVEAARRVRDQGFKARFLLLGTVDDNPHSLSHEQVMKWHAEGVIEWPGHVSNIQEWLSQADVFVLPSFYREGVPRSIQEAMALGRAIITTDNVGCRETVEDGVNGILVPPRDVDALADAMRKLIDKPGLARQMGKESRRLAEARFDARVADSRVIDLLGA